MTGLWVAKFTRQFESPASHDFLRFKEKAVKTVRTHVLLIPEAVNTKEMTKALKATSLSEWKGEVISRANNEFLRKHP